MSASIKRDPLESRLWAWWHEGSLQEEVLRHPKQPSEMLHSCDRKKASEGDAHTQTCGRLSASRRECDSVVAGHSLLNGACFEIDEAHKGIH